jgi:hypothetical protein
LVLASAIDDDLDSVTGNIGLQGGGWGPAEFSAVDDTLNDGGVVDNILSWSSEKENRDGSISSWLKITLAICHRLEQAISLAQYEIKLTVQVISKGLPA